MTRLLDAVPSDGDLILLYIALGIVGLLVFVGTVAAAVVRAILFFKYHNLNRKQNQSGLTAYQATRSLLDANGMSDVKVEKAGFFRAWIFGNYYSCKKKTIYLRKNIINKISITSVGVGLQKVGLAIMDRNGNKKVRVREKLLPMTFLAPVLFIPVVIVGFIIDFCFGLTGMPTLIASCIGLGFFLMALIYQFLNIPVEKQANRLALEIMEKSNFLSPEERSDCEQLFQMYITKYILDFVVSLLELLYDILKIIYNVLAKSKKK